MDIRIIKDKVSKNELPDIAKEFYVNMVKGAVDVENEIMALGGEYHVDANMVLIEHDSRQDNIWGFNLYLEKESDDWIEYVSLINIRPADGNRSMFIENKQLRDKIKEIINKKII